MPRAALSFLETPRKGHIPRNWDNTMLLISTALITIMK
jgi:hypothetical protein